MNQVKDHRLWIGHAGDGRDLRGIVEREIRAVVQLAIEEPPLHLPREIIAYRFPLVDGDGNALDLLRLAIDAVAKLIKRSIPVLVCCGGGMSRSPAIVAAAISLVERKDLHDCLKVVTASHPADVSPGLWDELCGVLKAPD